MLLKVPSVGKHLWGLDTEIAISTHGRPLSGTPFSAGAEAGGHFWRAGQVGALRLLGHSAPGISAAHVTCPLPLAARDGALNDNKG